MSTGHGSARPTPVPIEAPRGASASTLLWTLDGRPYLTVVVKAALTIVPGGVMTAAAPPLIVTGDIHYGNRADHSVRAPSDLVPYRPHVDVWLTGNACAPPGGPALNWTASLAIVRGLAIVLQKSINVRADAPAAYMPLLYERAIQADENPVGLDPRRGGYPNLLHPQGLARAASFGPISRSWPARRRLLGRCDAALADGPAPALPGDIDWRYFAFAPDDQRLDRLAGDEQIVLVGLHPQLARVESRLPGATARAWLYGAAPDLAAGKEIELRLDTLAIDVDQQTCCLVWRGNTAVPLTALGSLQARARLDIPSAAPRPVEAQAIPAQAIRARATLAPVTLAPATLAPATLAPATLAPAISAAAAAEPAGGSLSLSAADAERIAALSVTFVDLASAPWTTTTPSSSPASSPVLPFTPAPDDPTRTVPSSRPLVPSVPVLPFTAAPDDPTRTVADDSPLTIAPSRLLVSPSQALPFAAESDDSPLTVSPSRLLSSVAPVLPFAAAPDPLLAVAHALPSAPAEDASPHTISSAELAARFAPALPFAHVLDEQPPAAPPPQIATALPFLHVRDVPSPSVPAPPAILVPAPPAIVSTPPAIIVPAPPAIVSAPPAIIVPAPPAIVSASPAIVSVPPALVPAPPRPEAKRSSEKKPKKKRPKGMGRQFLAAVDACDDEDRSPA